MQNERSTRKRVRIADNLYERPGRTKVENRYQVGFNDLDGRWRMVTLKARNRTEARAERDDLLAKHRRGEVAAPSKITLGEIAAEYLQSVEELVAAEELGERTLERYRHALNHHVVPALGTTPIQKLTADHLARFLRKKREAGLAPWTIRGILTPLRCILAVAVRDRVITESPLSRLQPKELPKGKSRSEPRTLTREEIEALLAASPKRYRPLLAIAVFAGLRIQEILGLTWADIDFGAGVIHVRKQLTRGTKSSPPRRADLKTKAGQRDVVLLPELAALLQALLRTTEAERGLPRTDDFVFSTSEGTPLNRNNVAKRGLDKAAEGAGLNREGVPKLGFHDLRHTFASHLIRQGIDPVRASRQLGHARPSITLDIYAHEFDQARGHDDISEKLTAAFGGIGGS